MTYERVVIALRLYLLEQCLNPVFLTSIKTRNFVTFYKFLIHVGVHHTCRNGILSGKAWRKGLRPKSPVKALQMSQAVMALEARPGETPVLTAS
jgi:hypothetical protein